MGNSDDSYLLEYGYLNLKNESLGNNQNILNIVQMAGKLNSLNCELYEMADETGRLNFFKSNLARDVVEPTRRIGEFDSMLLERSRQARWFYKGLWMVDICQGWLDIY